MLKHHVLTVTPKTVDTLLPPVWVFGNPGVSKHQCVFTLQCLETPGVSKHLVFGNTKTGGSRVSTIFGVSKHLFLQWKGKSTSIIFLYVFRAVNVIFF